MKLIKFKKNQSLINISAIGFGAMGISEFYGATDDEQAKQALATAIEYGINHFDTADCYNFGENEKFLGTFFDFKNNPDLRKKIVIASKAGIIRDKQDQFVRGVSIEPKYLKGQLLKSIENLGVEYLDIFYIHRLPADATREELILLAEFLNQVRQEGLVKAVGVSEPSLQQLKTLGEICSIDFIQSEYNLITRFVERNGILEYCKLHDILFVAYSPLCRGLLTDSFDINQLESSDFRLYLPRFSGENYEYNKQLIHKLREFAATKQVSLSSLAIAWLLKQNVLVIPGMRKKERVFDIVKSLDIDLTEDDLETINLIAPDGATRGSRYSAAVMAGFKLDE